jgi:hypothetical protein
MYDSVLNPVRQGEAEKSPPWGDFTLAFCPQFCYDEDTVL